MDLKSFFLTLSMKEQLCITIIGLTILCILVIVSICGSLAYEFLKDVHRQKKLFFFEKYKDYIEACLLFQNFYLLQYEEIIKRIQKQIWEYQQSSSIYNFQSNFVTEENILYNIDTNSYYTIYNSGEKIINYTNFPIFYTCFYFNPTECSTIENILMSDYKTFSYSIFSPYDKDIIQIPTIGGNIMSTPVFFNINTFTIFSFDYMKMIEKVVEICGNQFDLTKIFRYYNNIINITKYNINDNLILFIKNKPVLLEHMFGNILREINETLNVYRNLNSFLDIAMSLSGYFPQMNYPNDKYYFINNIEELYYNYYIESNTINNYYYFINNKISSYIDMYFIPLYFENDTIISPDLCTLFLLKQINFQREEKEIDNIINNIFKGKTKIDECLINDNINNKIEINDILNLNMSSFLFMNNYTINHGLLYLNNSVYYFFKYSYPNYNSLKDFNSDYFILDQNNYYLFASFRDPINFSYFCFHISLKSFFILILIIIYVWIICLSINIFIFNKVIIQLMEPIKKLQEAVESSSINDENIFKYEYDEIINDLFLTSKNLLTGEINKNKKDIGNFHILSKSNNNYTNKSTNNLIIDNDTINKLILQQQNMMDFSKNIKLNDFSNHDLNYNDEQDINNQNNNNINNTISNKDLHNINNNLKDIRNNEKKNKELYIKLFQISEYLFYYKNKNKENYIKIIDNTKNKVSDINQFFDTRQRSRSTRGLSKHEKSKNDENENVVNMMNKKDIRYFWYMEAKKKNNKSLNYNVGKNYIELFSEYII